MDNIVKLRNNAPNETLNRAGHYSGHRWQVMYQPSLKLWTWKVLFDQPIPYEGTASTQEEAIKLARKKIKELVGVFGHAGGHNTTS